MQWKPLVALLVLFIYTSPLFAEAESETEMLKAKVLQLEDTVWQLQNKQRETRREVSKISETVRHSALSLLLFGFFCAWWAKSTGRSTLLWFLCGVLFHVLTAIALVVKTERTS